MSELIVAIESEQVGSVRADKSGRLSLEYTPGWRRSAQGYSLSASLLRGPDTHPHKAVMSYLWNLLPENPNVLQRWAQQFHVSGSNPFKLLAHVGADVPGAAQYLTPSQFEEIRSTRRPVVQWITEEELAKRLRELRADLAAMRRPGDAGKMSLPGAQAKTAFLWDEQTKRWGIPAGRTPTTHIIKPCVPGFDGLVENEHLCQSIAAHLGMPAAKSFVLSLDQTYIVVERYDRLQSGSRFPVRIHQEDLCQALGLLPGKKYQEEGGPGVSQIASLIRRLSAEPDTDVERFLRASIFNWLIGGTDAHAKNYSLLIGAGDEFRLAPLYDLSSQLPYPELIRQRLAMKIGDHYEIPLIGAADWRKLAKACALEEDRVLEMVHSMARALQDAIADASREALAEGLARKFVAPLAQQLSEHAGERIRSLTRTTGVPRRLRPRRA